MLRFPAFLAIGLAAAAQQPLPSSLPDAATIMAQVAVNQDRSEAERAHFLYVQHARITSRKGKTVRCEEITDSRVTPTDTGSKQHIITLAGRLLVKNDYVTYTSLPGHKKDDPPAGQTVSKDDDSRNDDDIDRGLVESMRNNLTDEKSKDGIGSGLFPLNSRAQAEYSFQFLGREPMNGRDTWHIRFQPKNADDYQWKGDAYIDTTAFQPVVVHTTLARKLPIAIRTLLGTNVPGLGFTITYAPQDGDVWFPATFGTEFKIHVLFLFSRQITMNAENRSFERTHVQSTIVDPVATP